MLQYFPPCLGETVLGGAWRDCWSTGGVDG